MLRAQPACSAGVEAAPGGSCGPRARRAGRPAVEGEGPALFFRSPGLLHLYATSTDTTVTLATRPAMIPCLPDGYRIPRVVQAPVEHTVKAPEQPLVAQPGMLPVAMVGAQLQPQQSFKYTLAIASPQKQKQMLGERLLPLLQRRFPVLADKITGILLEIDNAELVYMLEDTNKLEVKALEAVAWIQQNQGKEDLQCLLEPLALPQEQKEMLDELFNDKVVNSLLEDASVARRSRRRQQESRALGQRGWGRPIQELQPPRQGCANKPSGWRVAPAPMSPRRPGGKRRAPFTPTPRAVVRRCQPSIQPAEVERRRRVGYTPR